MAARRRKAFDGGDRASFTGGNGGDAGTDRFAVEMHGAGPALRDAASELRPGQSDDVAQHPEERHVGRYVDRLFLSVHGK